MNLVKFPGFGLEFNISKIAFNINNIYVYKYAVLLSQNKMVDKEIVELSALLHDISMTDSTLDRSKHNEYSSVIAKELLRQEGYPEEKIESVKKCILNHSSKKASYRTTEEENILVNADGLSHFDSISNLFSLAYNVMGFNELESLKFVQDKLTKDYGEISPELKYLIDDKYREIMLAKSANEIMDGTIKK